MDKGLVLCGIIPLDSSGKKVDVTEQEKKDFVKMLEDSDPSGRKYIYTEHDVVKSMVVADIISKTVNNNNE